MTTDEFQIRRGTREDADTVARLWMMNAREHATYDEIYTPTPNAEHMMRRFLRELASSRETCFFVATAGDKVIGFLTGELRGSTPAFVPRTWATVEDVFVHPDWRSRGVGRALVRRCFEWARSTGADGMALQVAAANKRARNFYARLGFREVSVYEALDLYPPRSSERDRTRTPPSGP
ncbi:GNAT family N-acetyltransferase [Rubrobacter taiwanensis]|jgi:ribosomal protein S18 acetylase RimI-like enzyme|uniref:GNAT family N-acetyltransferase n=1 Tax=Rubrobacter taiwanensis TaxID=185139 RepID=A0A4R1BDK6_9ACTN|nr:GNAT family N-acetyltransferase [Rubrobacter taiwanensis]TCJ15124.1 GNAT family N-acetyltransferase [Rubrobacter taiwanensis]